MKQNNTEHSGELGEIVRKILSTDNLKNISGKDIEKLKPVTLNYGKMIKNEEIRRKYYDGEWLSVLGMAIGNFHKKRDCSEYQQKPEGYFLTILKHEFISYLREMIGKVENRSNVTYYNTLKSALETGPSPVPCEERLNQEFIQQFWKLPQWQECEKCDAETPDELETKENRSLCFETFRFGQRIDHQKLRDYCCTIIGMIAKATKFKLLLNTAFNGLSATTISMDACADHDGKKIGIGDTIENENSDSPGDTVFSIIVEKFFSVKMRDEQMRFMLWIMLLLEGETGYQSRTVDVMEWCFREYGEGLGFKKIGISQVNHVFKNRLIPVLYSSWKPEELKMCWERMTEWLNDYFTSPPEPYSNSKRTAGIEIPENILYGDSVVCSDNQEEENDQ